MPSVIGADGERIQLGDFECLCPMCSSIFIRYPGDNSATCKKCRKWDDADYRKRYMQGLDKLYSSNKE